MRCSNETIYVLSIQEYFFNGINLISGHKIFSNADFYKIATNNNFFYFKKKCECKIKDIDHFNIFKNAISMVILENVPYQCVNTILDYELYKELKNLVVYADGIISYFDFDFPVIPETVKKNSDKPFIFFYKGDISLIKNISKNIAVIGVLNPEESIVNREINLVKYLVGKGLNIISGLARGCDTVAHNTCLQLNGRTIAILPTPLDKIYPSENTMLASQIVKNKGLLISEYFKKSNSKKESITRFINRDRLQAMFANFIVLSASYIEGKGDSGSRHAMKKAEEYGVIKTILYNPCLDKENPQFALNKRYYEMNKAHIISPSVIDSIIQYNKNKDIKKYSQSQNTLI